VNLIDDGVDDLDQVVALFLVRRPFGPF